MRTIAITTPSFFPGEAAEICRLLTDGGFWRIHIRKPGASDDEIRRLLAEIPENLRSRLSIHNALHLAAEFGLGGVHLNRNASTPPSGWQGIVSRSIHSLSELHTLSSEAYAFLSPIFPSISKQGYTPTISHAEITSALSSFAGTTAIYALGGVTPDKLTYLQSLGFSGAAMLGAAWRAPVNPAHFRLQFITHQTSRISTVEGARLALEGGCRWIQLRMKNASTDQLLSAGNEIADMCRRYKATFIIDDHVELVNTIHAHGVHLGLNDMPVSQARALLGPSKIIGATANTLTHMNSATAAGADYIGLGPFRFTHTKTNLSPILGLDGYRNLLSAYTGSLPVVAIGGITEADLPSLLSTGISGVALSSTILSDPDPSLRTASIMSNLTNC